MTLQPLPIVSHGQVERMIRLDDHLPRCIVLGEHVRHAAGDEFRPQVTVPAPFTELTGEEDSAASICPGACAWPAGVWKTVSSFHLLYTVPKVRGNLACALDDACLPGRAFNKGIIGPRYRPGTALRWLGRTTLAGTFCLWHTRARSRAARAPSGQGRMLEPILRCVPQPTVTVHSPMAGALTSRVKDGIRGKSCLQERATK